MKNFPKGESPLGNFFAFYKTGGGCKTPYHQNTGKGGLALVRHYNLYYLFLEDRERNPMDAGRKKEIQKNIEKFYEKIKPPPNAKPPTIRTQENT